MADNKLSWTELRRALATRAGVSDKEANTFLNAFNDQLVAALKSDKQVRVNGLGTFKLQSVAPRKSVNVSTGEQITIEGYNKIAFVPEAGVKELVESRLQASTGRQKPAVKNQQSEMDPLKKLGAQAEEIVDILGELGQEVKTSDKGTKDKGRKDKRTKEKGQRKKEEPIVQEPVIQEVAPVIEEPKKPEKPQKEKKQYHFMRDTLICVVILLMLLLVGYFFLRSQLSGWINELVNPTEVSVQPTESSIQESAGSDQQSAVSNQQSAGSDQQSEPAEEWTLDEIMLTEEIAEGSRLAWIAKKHYGDKAYWPYIYAANKERLSNPSVIPVGTPIRVPKLNAAMRDTTDVRFRRLREEAYGRVKE